MSHDPNGEFPKVSRGKGVAPSTIVERLQDRGPMLRRFAVDAVEALVTAGTTRTVEEHVETMTRLLRLVYAQGQRDAVEAMTAAVVPMKQYEP